jgi:hypothetical protein
VVTIGRPNEIKPYTEEFKATVTDCHDPERAGRVKIHCPAVHAKGEGSGWCPVILPPNYYSVPYEGSPVWVTFRDGDPTYPIVTGRRLLHNGKYTPAEFRDFSEGPYKEELNDATEHATDVWDDYEHKLVPEHGHPNYYDPYVSVFSYWQGSRWGVNEEPGEQGTFWKDRINQGFETFGDPANPLDPHKETRGAEDFTAEQLDDNSTLRTQEGWRALTRFFGTHGQYLAMRVRDKDTEEEIELMNTNSRNDQYGTLLLSNLMRRNELIRKVPGKEMGYAQVLDPRNPSEAYQRMYDWNGQEIFMDSAPGKQKIHVRVPGGESTTWDNIKGEILSKDRYGNQFKMGTGGVETNAYTQYMVNANTNIKMKANINVDITANINATVKGSVIATLEGGVIANVKAPIVTLGASPVKFPVAYLGSVVMTMVGPGTVITGSATVSTSP